MALELRPNCECCDKDLPPNSTEARICTFECTFCADCVETIVHNVCPNCGGRLRKTPHSTRKRMAARTHGCKAPGINKAGSFGIHARTDGIVQWADQSN
jgi:uncharacterized protein